MKSTKPMFHLLLMMVCLLLAMSPVAAQTLPPESLTKWAGTPGLDETAPAVVTPVAPDDRTDGLPSETAGLTLAFLGDAYERMADYLDRQMIISYIVIAGAVLAVIFVVYKTRDRLPQTVFETFRALSQDVLTQLARSNEARIEAAKQTPTPIDDALLQLLASLISEVSRVAGAQVSAPDVNQFVSGTETADQSALRRAFEKYSGPVPGANPDGTFG